jgi:HK97 gp10 family phage protein
MTRAPIQVSGLKEFIKAAKKAEDKVSVDVLKAANKEAAETVQQAASPLVPHRSGALASSLRSSGTVRAGIVRAGKAKVPYAGPIHFGWRRRNIKPTPFLYDALDERASEVVRVYEMRIEDLLSRMQTRA